LVFDLPSKKLPGGIKKNMENSLSEWRVCRSTSEPGTLRIRMQNVTYTNLLPTEAILKILSKRKYLNKIKMT